MTDVPFTITVYDGTAPSDALDDAGGLYREVYAEPPYLEGEPDFADFAESLPQRSKQASFRLVVARFGGEPVGFAMGHQLPAPTRWWEGALTPLPADVTTEHRGRTFAVIELAVRKPHRRRGLGRRLHAHLTVDLAEERKTLLVRPDAEAARAAYSQWGYGKIGQVQPFSMAPIYDAMISQ